MKRREFIILTGVGATSSTLLSACGHPEEKLIPALIPDDQFVPGVDYWKASTCGMCSAGCGIIVRTREHKANKIEGNPLHPVNRGALCARGQAGLEVLYNPDRIKGPMKRVGERGEGKWQEITWDEAIRTLADKLREIDPNSRTDKAQFVTGDDDGVTAYVAGQLMQAHRQAFFAGQSNSKFDPQGVYLHLLKDVVIPGEPIFDIGNSTVLFSFGARFLENWKSPVMYSQAYGEFRSGHGKARGRFVHIEPRMSLTAANADEWIAVAPGSEALVALAMIQVIVREGLNKGPASADSVRMLEEFSPERIASAADVPAERIIRLGREFAKAERPLAIGDLRFPDNAAVHLLNAAVANLNKPGGVLLVERSDTSRSPLKIPGDGAILPGESDEELAKDTTRESYDRLNLLFETLQHPYQLNMVHGFNPILTERKREKFLAVPFIVSFSSFMDETSEIADLILPDHTYLERSDFHFSYGPDGRKAVSLTQPVIAPQLNTRQTADVLLAVAREIGGEVGAALPFDSAKDIIEKAAGDLVKYIGGENVEAAWSDLTEKGLVSAATPVVVNLETVKHGPVWPDPFGDLLPGRSPKDENTNYPLNLIVYEHAILGDGSAANLPSIQELPDPMTSMMWGSWVEINPKTAATMGIADGDLVEVATADGSVRAPALLYPGIRPDCIAIPTGQGHSSFGRYARDRGADPRVLLRDNGTGSVKSRLAKIGGRVQLIRFGTELMEHLESKR